MSRALRFMEYDLVVWSDDGVWYGVTEMKYGFVIRLTAPKICLGLWWNLYFLLSMT